MKKKLHRSLLLSYSFVIPVKKKKNIMEPIIINCSVPISKSVHLTPFNFFEQSNRNEL